MFTEPISFDIKRIEHSGTFHDFQGKFKLVKTGKNHTYCVAENMFHSFKNPICQGRGLDPMRDVVFKFNKNGKLVAAKNGFGEYCFLTLPEKIRGFLRLQKNSKNFSNTMETLMKTSAFKNIIKKTIR